MSQIFAHIRPKEALKHGAFFLLTLLVTTCAGAEWMYGRMFPNLLFQMENALGWEEFLAGFAYSLSFLAFLTCHEFGHYFTARFYKLDVSLPFYIPVWLGFLGVYGTLGTMGAVIRIRSAIYSRKVYFDVGISGPLAGFVVALGVLSWGFTHLPPPEHIFTIHPEYAAFGLDYAAHVYEENAAESLQMGSNLLFEFFKHYIAPEDAHIPNSFEIMHYPFLLAGYLGLFFTALNLIPIGQLDGGHILYGLVGERWHERLSLSFFVAFVSYSGFGLISPDMTLEDLLMYAPIYLAFLIFLFWKYFEHQKNAILLGMAIFTGQFVVAWCFPAWEGYPGWLLFALLLSRVVGIRHPYVPDQRPLNTTRKVLGWVSLLIFILCFSPKPFIIG